MKKLLFLALTVITVLVLAGCQDEIVRENKSPGEKIGEEIMKLAKEHNITHMHFEDMWPSDQSYAFKISGEIMAVFNVYGETEYYNLNYVQRYRVDNRFIDILFLNPNKKASHL